MLLVDSQLSNFLSSAPSAPICSNSSIFRWHGNSFTNYPPIYVVNTTCPSCSSSAWFALTQYPLATHNIEGYVVDVDGSLTGSPQAILPASYWTASCALLSSNLYACPLALNPILKFQSIAPDYLNRTITPVVFQDMASNATFSPL